MALSRPKDWPTPLVPYQSSDKNIQTSGQAPKHPKTGEERRSIHEKERKKNPLLSHTASAETHKPAKSGEDEEVRSKATNTKDKQNKKKINEYLKPKQDTERNQEP